MRYRYGVVLYQPPQVGTVEEENVDVAMVYHSEDINSLVEAVKEHIATFELTEDDFNGGQVFDKQNERMFIGTITYNGEYIPTKAV